VTRYLLDAIVRLYRRIRPAGIDKVSAEVYEDHRDRDAYEAEIAKVEHDRLSAKDEAEVAELRAFVEEIGSGEFPSLAFDADPLGAPIPDGHRVEAEAFFHDLFADKISAFTWVAAERSTVALSSVQVVEPAPFELEGPTGVFSRDWINKVIARVEAEASR
jgi:hypothetical protein